MVPKDFLLFNRMGQLLKTGLLKVLLKVPLKMVLCHLPKTVLCLLLKTVPLKDPLKMDLLHLLLLRTVLDLNPLPTVLYHLHLLKEVLTIPMDHHLLRTVQHLSLPRTVQHLNHKTALRDLLLLHKMELPAETALTLNLLLKMVQLYSNLLLTQLHLLLNSRELPFNP